MTSPNYVPVGNIAEIPEGGLRMIRVDGRRVCLIRLTTGVHAIDNACPHEGYGLTQGDLVGDELTCVWHNWKFRVSDGRCTKGEENITSHHVRVDADGSIHVALRSAVAGNDRVQLFESLRRGIERDYVGQVSRDVIRLLQASADPGELVWQAIGFGAPRAEFGWGHSIASATDCLAMVDLYDGVERALPIVQAIAGISESERDRRVESLPDPGGLPSDPSTGASRFRQLVEAERLEPAQTLVRAAVLSGSEPAELQRWFTQVVSDHHLSYGHGAIYVQKAFELLSMIGWERADTVLPHLVPTIVNGTREDRLPYMRPFMKRLGAVDLSALAAAAPRDDWEGRDGLTEALLGADRTRAFDATIDALQRGAGADGVLDAAVLASSERMLRYDVDGERDFLDDFGWLDITHGVTYAHAVRWHHAHAPGPDTLRLVLFATFLAFWTGRHEWHTRVPERADIVPLADDLHTYGVRLQQLALGDPAASFIVQAHAVKNSRAAALESGRMGSAVPLAAAQRFVEAPKLQRFVAATVARSLAFLDGRAPRDDMAAGDPVG